MKRFIDIGANLTDPMYCGLYHGSQKHEPDLTTVLKRAWDTGLNRIIVTGGSLDDSKKAIEIANTDANLFCTVGCHPTRCQEFETGPDEYMDGLEKLIQDGRNKIVAVGECGLDYDRLHFCPKDIQKKYFNEQLKLSLKLKLPLFLHCRNAAEDFIGIVSKHENLQGVVHSFDGSISEAEAFVKLGFYIGINGCSLKTDKNLEVVKIIPSDRLMLETDAPWCEIRPTHAGYQYVKTQYPSVKKEKWNSSSLVKGRNEPCSILQVLEIISAVRNENIDTLMDQVYNNTMKLFF